MPTEACLEEALAVSGWKKSTPLRARESGPEWLQQESPTSSRYILFTSADARNRSAHGGMSFVPIGSGFDVYLELSGSGRVEDSSAPSLLGWLKCLYEELRS